jgi:hypothetical protein
MTEEKLDLTGFCGLYCEDCGFKKGRVNDLAQEMLDEFAAIRMDRIAEVIPFLDNEKYIQVKEFLATIASMKCTGCRDSVRSQFCDAARCAREKGLSGCWQCPGFSACSSLDLLAHVHGDAHIRNMQRINEIGLDAWVKEGPLW